MIKIYSDLNDSIFLEKNYLSNYVSSFIKDSIFAKSLLDVDVNDVDNDDKNKIVISINLKYTNKISFEKLEHFYYEIKYLLKSIFLIEQPKINIILE